MRKVRLLGASLLLATSISTAGAAAPEKAQTLTGYAECDEAAHHTAKRVSDPRRSNASMRDDTGDGAVDTHSSTIDEYLSFHARVTEDNGKFTLMPWSALRTHAN